MSKKSERREAERLARRAAYLKSLKPTEAAEPTSEPAETPAAKPETKISEAQLNANRANARLSHGPITPEGRAASCLNNTRHGLNCEGEGENFRVLGDESQADYDKALANFRKEWKPATATENDLVNRLVMHQWLRRRALRLQADLFDPQSGDITDMKKFELYRRYETQHERGFNKSLADLLRLRSLQIREQNGIESQRRKEELHDLKVKAMHDREKRQRLQYYEAEAKLTLAQSKLVDAGLLSFVSRPNTNQETTAAAA